MTNKLSLLNENTSESVSESLSGSLSNESNQCLICWYKINDDINYLPCCENRKYYYYCLERWKKQLLENNYNCPYCGKEYKNDYLEIEINSTESQENTNQTPLFI